MITFDPVILSLAALAMSTLSLMAIVGYGTKKLLDRPPVIHGPEVTDVEAIFGRPDVSEETLRFVPAGTVYSSRN